MEQMFTRFAVATTTQRSIPFVLPQLTRNHQRCGGDQPNESVPRNGPGSQPPVIRWNHEGPRTGRRLRVSYHCFVSCRWFATLVSLNLGFSSIATEIAKSDLE